ncbi:MAG TPA: hypothetical protein VM266_05820 [Solirubrobacteraceae bacterium]|nr:hypothetical protein [Solirubrobacteraceae bacterium]
MRSRIHRCLLGAAAALALAAPGAAAQTTGDAVMSDNVQHLGNLREVGTGVGATIVGDHMYVTSTHALVIYDIKSDPARPELVGTFTLDVQFENEEVPTNGKILGISSDTFCVVVDPNGIENSGGSCLAVYDVSDPENVKLLTNIPDAGDHTSACLLDCTWMYGSNGSIIDLRDPKNGKKLGVRWTDALVEQGYEQVDGCHHVREVQPGIAIGSCQPLVLFSVRPQDGGSPESPVMLATGSNEDGRFIHSTRWPRDGRDKFLLVGGEEVIRPECDDTVSAFMTWDATKAQDGLGGFPKGGSFTLIDEVRPVQGTVTDGHNPYNVLGCSVHWFQEHPTFRNGGLVALAEYEQGTRFEQITPEGKIVEQGYFLPAGGSASAAYFNPHDPSIVYVVDYTRGVDVLKWTGDTYVPTGSGDVVADPNATPGTGGKGPDQPACASASGFNSAAAAPRGGKVAFRVNKREDRPFAVDVFQQSSGRRVLGNRLIARFTNRRRSFTWNGRDRTGRRPGDGNYFVRFRMKTSSGAVDSRRVTLTRRGGRFRKAPAFYQRIDCGAFQSLKLSSSAFGGTSGKALGIAYKLAVPATEVRVQVKVGRKVVRTLTGEGAPNRTYRLRVPASVARAGKLVRVVVTAQRSQGRSPTITLAARRL